MAKTKEAWCCGIAADHEIGNTDVKIYATKDDVLKNAKCSVADPHRCAPRRLTITIHDQE